MKNLYRFYCDCGRMGSLEGIFVSTENDIAALMGRDVYFGEVLGKHSEIIVTIDEDSIVLLTDDQDFIQKAEEYGLVPSGFNPFDFIEND